MKAEKLSQNMRDNYRVWVQLKWHIAYSKKIQILCLQGIWIKEEGWAALGQGVEKSKHIKKLVIQNCNIGDGGMLEALCTGLSNAESLELLDLQMNSLKDHHGFTICKVM